MEFLTTKQKKQKARRLFVVYGLLTILVSLATYVLISTALGFDLFRGKDVIQNGLLFIDSRPDNAVVYLNSNRESNNTNAKYSVPESSYEVSIQKDGYRHWNGTVQIVGGTVEFLTYPRLLPDSPALIRSQSHTSLPSFLQSRDKQWLASVVSEVPNQVVVYNVANPNDFIRTLTIPSSLTAEKPLTAIELVEWAGDNDHFLVKVTITDVAEPKYILLHREKPTEIVDVSALFPIGVGDEIGFWDGKRDVIYIKRTNGVVFIANVKDKALTAQSLIGETVIQFQPLSDEKALYTTVMNDQLFIKLYAKEKTYTITTTDVTDQDVVLKAFGFNRNDYFIVGGAPFGKTYIYRNFEKSIASSSSGRVAPFFTMPFQSSLADVSRNNRFVMTSNGSDAAIYDIEQREYYRYELPVTRPAELGWLDDVRLYAVGADKKLTIMDFNGKNTHEIGNDVLGMPYVDKDVSVLGYQSTVDGNITTRFLDIESATPTN